MHRSVLERILAVISGSVAIGACVDWSVGGETVTDTSTGATGTTSSGAASTGGDTDHGGTAAPTPTPDVKFDLPVEPTFPDLPDDGQGCVVFDPDTTFVCRTPEPVELVYRCVPPPRTGDCTDVDLVQLQLAINGCLDPGCGESKVFDVQCGPDPTVADACCWWFEYDLGVICPGRPFLVDGRERLAPLVERSDWSSPATDPLLADPRACPLLAAALAEAGSFEHASVASFARFTLELLALGAPADLVAGATTAAAEEAEHARLWFGLAALHGARPVGPGPLDTAGALRGAVDLGDVAVRAVAEGCIAETISAWQIRVAAMQVQDPSLAQRLHRLAEEELRHCELAWGFARWVLGRDPSLRARIAAVFQDAAAHVPRGPAIPAALDPAVARAHGLLPPADHMRLAAAALERLVIPAARALLSGPIDVRARAAAPLRALQVDIDGRGGPVAAP